MQIKNKALKFSKIRMYCEEWDMKHSIAYSLIGQLETSSWNSTRRRRANQWGMKTRFMKIYTRKLYSV